MIGRRRAPSLTADIGTQVAPPPIVALDRVSRTYALDGVRVEALRDVSLAVGQGEFVAIVGPSADRGSR